MLDISKKGEKLGGLTLAPLLLVSFLSLSGPPATYLSAKHPTEARLKTGPSRGFQFHGSREAGKDDPGNSELRGFRGEGEPVKAKKRTFLVHRELFFSRSEACSRRACSLPVASRTSLRSPSSSPALGPALSLQGNC